MAEQHYCWRCKQVVPMLDENEWAQIEPFLRKDTAAIQEYRTSHGVSLQEALSSGLANAAKTRYFDLTGYLEPSPAKIWHHRLSSHGRPCGKCGHLLRTPRARVCAECGELVADHPASHYLRIYRIRMQNPKAAGQEYLHRFVASLEKMDPDAPVRLNVDCETNTARFTDAKSGLLLAEWRVDKDPEAFL